MKDNDRYLKQQKSRRVWMYCRAVPKRMHGIDGRAPTVTISTGKRSIYEAKHVRDLLAEADDNYWAAFDAGLNADTAREKYEAAVQMRDAKGVAWFDMEKSYAEMEESGEIRALEKRFNDAWRDATGKPIGRTTREEMTNAAPVAEMIMAGTIGTVDAPEPDVREACRIWIEEMIPHEWRGKSPEQLRIWNAPINRSVNSFVDVVGGNKAYIKTTRQEVLQYHSWLNKRVLTGKIGASMANRSFGVLRRIWKAHADHLGIDDPNPFRNLRWAEKKASRPAFSVDWLTEHFLDGKKLVGLNVEARRVLLAMIETGCRPSEIVSLQSENIHLDHNVPHIHIRSMEGMEIKTSTSERRIPLVGVALEALQLQPDGFPRYFDKGSSYSALVNKYIKNNGLAETTGHTAYSVRHSFENRTKAAGLDYEMRKQLMGHSSSRPEYGDGFSLENLQEALEGIALPFDEGVV